MTKKWEILIDYSDGDTENHWECSEYLPVTWENLEIAKENLKRLALWDKMERGAFYGRKEVKYSELDGYIERTNAGDYVYSPYSMTVKLDDGTEQPVQRFWSGHCCSVRRISIVLKEEDDEGMTYQPY